MATLIFDEGIVADNLIVVSVNAAQWDTVALGCPEPGVYYDTQGAPFFGVAYVLSDGANSWEYHTNADDTVTVRCNGLELRSGTTTVNITREANLRESSGLTLMRRNFSNNVFEEDDPITPADLDRIVDILDVDTALSPAAGCTTVFRLDFETPGGTREVEFICEENFKDFNIIWQGIMGRAPILGNIIGPYLTGDPIPSLPTAIP